MPLTTLEVVGFPSSRIIEQPIDVSNFGGNAFFTLGYIHLDRTIGPMQAATSFYVIDACTSYYLLERSWNQKHKVVSSTYHHCLKAIWKDKKVMPLPLSIHFREMKFISQRQSSLTN